MNFATDDPQAQRDALTGLPGRDAVRARLGEWSAEGQPVHGVLIGLRRLDTVNLAYGSATGDAVLAEVAARVRHFAASELEGPWIAARIGGGQFLLLSTESCSRERWQLFAAQMLEGIARPIATNGATVRLSARAAMLRGLADEPADSQLDRLAETLTSLMQHAGKRLAWADGETTRVGRSAAQLEADLLAAIDRDEIEIVYQPQFSCLDDRLTGAEALARWNHPELGRVGAGVLFATAERSDQVAPISRHIARKAMLGANHWPMDLRLSLNITPSDLAVPDLAAEFSALVQNCKFAAWRLTLEMTEQVLLGDIAHAQVALAKLADAGMRIALDDFGAGFCNFRYLKQLPLHFIKLDRSMIDGVVSDQRDLAVLRAIIAMAKALDLKVIAEGVETEAQRVVAATEGCATWQGFLRARPMSADAFLELARS